MTTITSITSHCFVVCLLNLSYTVAQKNRISDELIIKYLQQIWPIWINFGVVGYCWQWEGMEIEMSGKIGMGMRGWTGNGWEWAWDWFYGNGSRWKRQHSFPYTSTVYQSCPTVRLVCDISNARGMFCFRGRPSTLNFLDVDLYPLLFFQSFVKRWSFFMQVFYYELEGCIWRGSGGFDPTQEVVDPQKVLQNLFGGRL